MNTINYIFADYTALWINTIEYERYIDETIKTLKDNEDIGVKNYAIWDIHKGVYKIENDEEEIIEETTMDPFQPITYLTNMDNEVIFVLDYHCYIQNNVVWRALLDSMSIFSQRECTFIIISPMTSSIPKEINRYITIIDFSLPTEKEIENYIEEYCHSFNCTIQIKNKKELITAGKGLTKYELEQALSLSLTTKGAILPEFINEQKKQLVKSQSSLLINNSTLDFNSLYGMEELKYFSKKMVGKGKGILLVGVPGGGKSHFANTLGTETNRITINMDFSSMMDSLVGETERKTASALQTIDAMEPCILFIDEIEKGLAGVSGYNGDSGTSQRQGGQFLKWLSDHTSDVYIIATSNDISKLPPEYLRAERWDAIFFVDLPNEEERKGICELYKKEYNVIDDELPNIENWTGAEIKTLYRLSNSLDLSLIETSKYVTPIFNTMKEKINNLRNWAKGRTISASKICGTNKKSNKKRNITMVKEI